MGSAPGDCAFFAGRPQSLSVLAAALRGGALRSCAPPVIVLTSRNPDELGRLAAGGVDGR